MVSRPFVFEKMHQVYYVLDGAILVGTEDRALQDFVRSGKTVFIPARMEVSLSFADRFVRFWSFTTGEP